MWTSSLIRFSTLCILAVPPSALVADERSVQTPAPNLDLPVVEFRETHEPYASYCNRHPDYCDLSGPQLVEFSRNTLKLLESANTAINRSIDCSMTDLELYGFEEFWEIPSDGFGDCEDIALIKRERLVEIGLPRGAMTIAIVHHQKTMSQHAVLLVETTAGTYLLNSLADDVALWHEAPYNFEARERPDGSWERFDQDIWAYE